MAHLTFDTYGKTRVRLIYLKRTAERHEIRDLTAKILFEGGFQETYTTGDNSKVLPTDTMKNTVYALARQTEIASVEEFARTLAKHFLEHVEHLQQVQIYLAETPWQRRADHPAAFMQAGDEQRTVHLTATLNSETIVLGIHNLQILKTGDSAFTGYLKDKFTTLPETEDRLLGTVLEAEWQYPSDMRDFDAAHQLVRDTLLDSFALHHSLSVQHTLFHMAQAVLDRVSAVSEIHLTMPNKHCILADLTRFGLDNPNQIFVPIDEPSGYIEARITR